MLIALRTDSDRVLADERLETDVTTSEILARIAERVRFRLTGRLCNFQQRTALFDFRTNETSVGSIIPIERHSNCPFTQH